VNLRKDHYRISVARTPNCESARCHFCLSTMFFSSRNSFPGEVDRSFSPVVPRSSWPPSTEWWLESRSTYWRGVRGALRRLLSLCPLKAGGVVEAGASCRTLASIVFDGRREEASLFGRHIGRRRTPGGREGIPSRV